MPDQPCSVTVNTSCSGNSRLNLRGTHSSSSAFIFLCQKCFLHAFKNLNGFLPADRWEIIKELIKSIASLKIIEQGLNRNASADKYRCAAKNIVRTLD